MNDRLSIPGQRGTLPEGELDGLLRAYFRHQMPAKWPAPPQLEPRHPVIVPLEPRRPRLRQRLALAAAIGLFLLGYLGLSQVYPDLPGFQPFQTGPRFAGQPLDAPRAPRDNPLPALPGPARTGTEPTRSGGTARYWEQKLPGNRITILVQPEQPQR
jgi:hypothetical protein